MRGRSAIMGWMHRRASSPLPSDPSEEESGVRGPGLSAPIGPDRLAMIMKDGEMHLDPKKQAPRFRTTCCGTGIVKKQRREDRGGDRRARPRDAQHHELVSWRPGA